MDVGDGYPWVEWLCFAGMNGVGVARHGCSRGLAAWVNTLDTAEEQHMWVVLFGKRS